MTSAEFTIDRQPVGPSDSAYYIFAKPVDVAEGCTTCPALSIPAIRDVLHISEQGVQLSLEAEAGTVADHSVHDLSRAHKERILETYKERAEAGMNGTCPYAEVIIGCWRRNTATA